MDCHERIKNHLSTDCPQHRCRVGCKGQKLANPFSMTLRYCHTVNFHCQDLTASSTNWILQENTRTVSTQMYWGPRSYGQQHASPLSATIMSFLHSVDCQEQLSLNTVDCHKHMQNHWSTNCPQHGCWVGCKGQQWANLSSMTLCYCHTIDSHCLDQTASSTSWILPNIGGWF